MFMLKIAPFPHTRLQLAENCPLEYRELSRRSTLYVVEKGICIDLMSSAAIFQISANTFSPAIYMHHLYYSLFNICLVLFYLVHYLALS